MILNFLDPVDMSVRRPMVVLAQSSHLALDIYPAIEVICMRTMQSIPVPQWLSTREGPARWQ